MIKTVSIAAIVAMASTASYAGSLSSAEEYKPAQQEDIAVVPAGSSGIGLPVVLGGVLVAGAAAALLKSDSDSATVTVED